MERSITYATPSGASYKLYDHMLEQDHLLVAGKTGSGKSVVINGMIHSALFHSPATVGFILIDPKRVELYEYRNLPHVFRYASEPDEIIATLAYALEMVEDRGRKMREQGTRKYIGSEVYVIIDELADLMLTGGKQAERLIQRISQIGRASRVHLVAATQCPLAKVISTPIMVNIDSRIGLRTRSAKDSRNILGVKGCETLPRFGKGYYMTPEGIELVDVPMVPDDERERLVDYWMHTQPEKPAAPKRRFSFARLFA